VKALGLFDWAAIQDSLDREGYATLPEVLCDADCDAWLEFEAAGRQCASPLGELPAALYQRLVPLAERWNTQMGLSPKGLLRWRLASPTYRFRRLFEGQHQPLSQDPDGECAFRLSGTLLLSDPDRNFRGGEFVMTEQRPRMQSRAHVVALDRGDAALFAANYRPVKGTKGIYRVNMRHAVSSVTKGNRAAVDFVFHHVA
jgi:uncharacterized protein